MSLFSEHRLLFASGAPAEGASESFDWKKEVGEISDAKQEVRKEFYERVANLRDDVETPDDTSAEWQEIKETEGFLFGALVCSLQGDRNNIRSREARQTFAILKNLSAQGFNVDHFAANDRVRLLNGKIVVQRANRRSRYEVYDTTTSRDIPKKVADLQSDTNYTSVMDRFVAENDIDAIENVELVDAGRSQPVAMRFRITFSTQGQDQEQYRFVELPLNHGFSKRHRLPLEVMTWRYLQEKLDEGK